MKNALIALTFFGFINHSVAQEVSWSENIACLVFSHCAPCHNPNGIAPFSLLDYEEAYVYRFAIDYMVGNRLMPPWKPDRNFSSFVDERYLSDDEIDLIHQWVVSGAKEGDTIIEPPPPVFENNWSVPNPDISIKLPDYVVAPAFEGRDDVQCFVLPIADTMDRTIVSFELLPGNRNVVHHAHVHIDTSSIPFMLDSADANIGYDCWGGAGGSPYSKKLFTYLPGTASPPFPDNFAIELPANANLIVEIHYPTAGAGQLDSSRVNLKFSDDPNLRIMYLDGFLGHNFDLIDGPLFIPADSIKTFHERFVAEDTMTFFGIQCHCHYVCESFGVKVNRPGEPSIPLIKIDNWDPAWQETYWFERPVIIYPDDRLFGQATYNNTSSNPRNPFSPPQDISTGGNSTDEMMQVGFAFTQYEPGDELLTISNPDHPVHHLDCNPFLRKKWVFDHSTPIPLRNAGLGEFESVDAFPNPTSDMLTVLWSEKLALDNMIFELLDLSGKLLFKATISNGSSLRLPTDLGKGFYFYRLSGPESDQIFVKKLILE